MRAVTSRALRSRSTEASHCNPLGWERERVTMATNPNSMAQEAVDAAISKRGEIGLQVVAYVDGKQVVDVWGGLADITTGRQVDADTHSFRCSPSPRR